jgi:hypothetical protein
VGVDKGGTRDDHRFVAAVSPVGLSSRGRKGIMRRIWPHYGDDPSESRVLEDLLRRKVRRAVESSSHRGQSESHPDHGGLTDEAVARYNAFLKYQYGERLRNYRFFAGKYSFAFTILSVSAIASGGLSAGIAAGWSEASWARWTILILGVVAATAAATIQLWRPGQKAASRMRGANALTSEGWAYLNDRGAYRAKNEGDALDVFVDEVARILQIVAAVDEELPPPNSGPPPTP